MSRATVGRGLRTLEAVGVLKRVGNLPGRDKPGVHLWLRRRRVANTWIDRYPRRRESTNVGHREPDPGRCSRFTRLLASRVRDSMRTGNRLG